MGTTARATLVTAPLTPDRWDDLVLVFGKDRGVQCQCW